MTRIRTFIAVPLDKPIRDRIVALQDDLSRIAPEVKWVEPENLHVTLLFLGEVDEREIHTVCGIVAKVCAALPSFPMTVEKAGCFGNARRPRTLWVGVGTGLTEICALHDALEPPLMELGCYRREDREYTPHITLGRVRTDQPNDDLAKLLGRRAAWQGGQLTVREVHVMSSEMSRGGPMYTVLSRARLV
jgi:2'-5' RNA ligase